MIHCPPRRDLITEQRLALIEALKRYGYTHVGYAGFEFSQPLHLADAKPYYVYIAYGALVILHRECTDCDHIGFHHEADFLKAMILVIGRLDAFASYDSGEDHGWSPRLWISL